MKTVVLPKSAIYSGSLILVNAAHAVTDAINPSELLPLWDAHNKVLLERKCAILLERLMKELNGWERIAAVSGWRSQAEQTEIFERSLADNGAAFTEQYVAKPGHSEHQSGLAIDLGLRQGEIDFIRPLFPYNGICQSFREQAVRFGFVERYPLGKEHLTGIAHEPWHFRYVCMPHAAIMTERGLVLEEYHDFIKQFPYTGGGFCYQQDSLQLRVSYLSADWESQLEIEESALYSISGNNVDGYVITEWENRNV